MVAVRKLFTLNAVVQGQEHYRKEGPLGSSMCDLDRVARRQN